MELDGATEALEDPAAGAPFLLELLEILAAIEELERARRRERARRII